ncbi:hypothetical protein LMORI2_20460 [Limnohabitans sp. MORI2]|jgi:hypothetical protein|uniref:hypothetical protein n=1 Tax=Limnohabitans sp. MORI2 TaxID=1751150 RepID=UPI0023777376|nr:hypothetical protein [Limnohabitans sp. MORI2]BDU59064.1 hypothetical protein LMORI2_20460 [Limnohabitans sp. MORI2]
MKKKNQIIGVIAVVLALGSASLQAAPLITPKEAQMPAASGELKTRGIARGPGIKVISPDVTAPEIKGPFDLKVVFESRGGNKIDASAVKVTYLKATAVDLTPRLKDAITENGIDFAKAEVPPGEHSVKITVKDVDGRESSTVMNLVVGK